jgi:hypothetical protein
MNHQGAFQSVDTSSSPTDVGGSTGRNKTNYIPSEQVQEDGVLLNNEEMRGCNEEMHQSQSHPVTVDAPLGRYAEDYDPADVTHILQKSQTAFETLKKNQD